MITIYFEIVSKDTCCFSIQTDLKSSFIKYKKSTAEREQPRKLISAPCTNTQISGMGAEINFRGHSLSAASVIQQKFNYIQSKLLKAHLIITIFAAKYAI